MPLRTRYDLWRWGGKISYLQPNHFQKLLSVYLDRRILLAVWFSLFVFYSKFNIRQYFNKFKYLTSYTLVSAELKGEFNKLIYSLIIIDILT